MEREEIPKRGNNFINIIITQAICVLVIIALLLSFKYLFKNEYKSIKKWYAREIATDTDVNEVLK